MPVPRWLIRFAAITVAMSAPQIARADLTYEFIAQITNVNSTGQSPPPGVEINATFSGTFTLGWDNATLTGQIPGNATYSGAIKELQFTINGISYSSNGIQSYGENRTLLTNNNPFDSNRDGVSASINGQKNVGSIFFYESYQLSLSAFVPAPGVPDALTSLDPADLVLDLNKFNESARFNYYTYKISGSEYSTLGFSSTVTSLSLQQPAALPEPSGWVMMIVGSAAPFAIGMWMRRRANAAAMAA